jgi:nucleotide-binding universal stress UspA family protein
MRKVLIPTDFSDNAMNAIKYAIALFKYNISEFYIMHAYQDDIYTNETLIAKKGLDNIIETIHQNSEKGLQKTLQTIKNISPNPKHTYHLISANNLLIDEADKIVEKQNIDIIVMGTKGKTNDKKITFGSHTLQVLRYVQCPVLAIPENYVYKQPKHILFPTNYLIPYKRRELKLLCEMVYSYRAVIDMLYISISDKLSLRQKDNREFINEHLCKNKINFNVENSQHIIDTIYKYINKKQIDLLVMVNTRHSFLENILFQSTIDELSLNLGIPFLTLQNIKRY